MRGHDSEPERKQKKRKLMARFRFFWARGFLCCVGVFCVLVDERVFWCMGDFFLTNSLLKFLSLLFCVYVTTYL